MKGTKAAQANNLGEAIREASNCINSFYPLTNFVACNALKGLEKIPFEDAMRKSSQLFGTKGFLALAEYRAMYESGRIAPRDLEEAFHNKPKAGHVKSEGESVLLCVSEMFDRTSKSRLVEIINKQLIKWCGAYLDRTQAQWRPSANKTLYAFWKELASHDNSMCWHGVRNWSQSVNALPHGSQETLEQLLSELDIHGQQVAPYLMRHVVQMPGFCSYLKWRETENLEEGILTDYLAIRLHYEKMLCQVVSQRLFRSTDLGLVRPLLESENRTKRAERTAEHDDYAPVWQDAYEINYRNRLLSSLRVDSEDAEDSEYSKDAEDNACCQLIFCIDVRSEPIRRRLEQLGPYSTYGFAGFFGMPMRLTELGSAQSLDLCPVLLKPQKEVTETADAVASAQKLSWQALKVSALQLKKKLKCNLVGAFGLVELFGLCSTLPLVAKTFAPAHARSAWDKFEQAVAGEGDTMLDLSAFCLTEKVALAEGALKGIGLTRFGKVIVFCGHKSSSANNPFASSLDCGACGGNGGGFSARLAALILNDEEVRESLSHKGIQIPEDTLFIAAEHDTTTDQFLLFNGARLSDEQAQIVSQLKLDLARAGESLRKARVRTLPKSCLDFLNDPLERACDWAQTAPEWGLAGNAAFIAAPRAVSKDADLEGRVFLHSYDYSIDDDGKVLELIMTAPLVVAQWINMQYYLSTVDNHVFGSGSKVLHNVIGDFGVMQGAMSDLRIGLPLQSLMTSEGLRHEPMRLLAVIRAPLSAIENVLNKHDEVRQLVSNRWIRLVALDPEKTEFYEAEDGGRWRRLDPARTTEEIREVTDGFAKV
jgi:uncharacterized protein YbcC (UPF0753/DUF2309 family)